jgi:hypothetical protein
MVELPRSGYRRRQNTKKAVIANRLDFGRYSRQFFCSNCPDYLNNRFHSINLDLNFQVQKKRLANCPIWAEDYQLFFYGFF